MVNPTDGGKTEATRQPVTMGIALELENLAYPGRHLLYTAMERGLKDKDVTLTPVIFSRFALRPPMAKCLEGIMAMAGKKKISVDKLAQDIEEHFHQSLKKSSVHIDPAIEGLLTEAAKAKVQVGVLSFLPADLAQELVERAEIKASLALHVVADHPKGHPTPDEWLKLAKAMNLPPCRCVALTTADMSCKSALVAGMRCVVFPDVYTAHQDFGGADRVIDNPKEFRFKELIALLHSCTFR